MVTEGVLRNGRFEDVTFTSLAPLLRRHGYYLLHAFAAVKEGHAILLVGPSGSGKTTTGLHLLEAGLAVVGQ
jgi:serine kinase of HPr protein (carbohydrate metabolism regulator)